MPPKIFSHAADIDWERVCAAVFVEHVSILRPETCSHQRQRHLEALNRLTEIDIVADRETIGGNTWSPLETNFDNWLRHCSWGCCSSCQVIYQRHLQEDELVTPLLSERRLSAMCDHCKAHGTRHRHVACAQDWPSELLNLSRTIQFALQLVVLHQGTPQRHANGYFRKDSLSHCSWHTTSVTARVEALSAEDGEAARTAFQWLMLHNFVYKAWHDAHTAVLQQASPCLTWLPSQILEPYLETAIWPLLYPKPDMCESAIWASGSWRPFGRHQRSADQHVSMKAAFMSKVCSSVVDYSRATDLLQFQFDRHIFRTVLHRSVVARNRGADTSCFFADRHWAPGHWERHHALLLDVVDQLGDPDLFITVSPYEWHFPWPHWVDRIHAVCRAGPTDCPAAEVLAVAHALHQLCAGFLAGRTGGKTWKRHIFANKNDDKAQGVRAYFGRFEFQDKGQEQEFGKGRGSLHLHCLFWLGNLRDVLLQHYIAAELPKTDPQLCSWAKRVLRGHAASRAPMHTGPSECSWDPNAQRWVLSIHHGADFADLNLRPFLIPVLRLLKCAQDVQWWHSRGALLRYVAGYASKYGENMDASLFDDAPDSMSTALHVCWAWKPAAAEMLMALARESMAFTSVHHKTYRVPSFDNGDDTALYLYRRRPTSEEHVSFVAWLRWHTITGSLESGTYAAKPLRHPGVSAVAMQSYRISKDEFFWQWMSMHVPHRSTADLLPASCFRASTRFQFFAAAVLKTPSKWGFDPWILEFLQKQGHKDEYCYSLLGQFQARRALVFKQMQGMIPRNAPLLSSKPTIVLSLAQQTFFDNVMIDLELVQQSSVDGDVLDRMLFAKRAQPYFLTGGPGAGKSVVCWQIADAASLLGHKILITSPTGKLAADIVKRANVVSVTIARAFLQPDIDAVVDYVKNFSLWVVCEIGMCTRTMWERIYYCWNACARIPVCVVEGDFQQLPPPVQDPEAEDVRRSPHFHWQHAVHLQSQFRCHDAELLRFQLQIRTRLPSQADLDAVLFHTLVSRYISAESLHRAWEMLPEAPVLTATRQMSNMINLVALHAQSDIWLLPLPVWAQTTSQSPRLDWIRIRRGTRLMITRNSNVEMGFVNGATATLREVLPAGLVLDFGGHTDILHRRSAWMSTENGGTVLRAAYDVAMAYAMTVHKAEGATLSTLILVCEDFAPPGWGYTAITRVRRMNTLRIVGDVQLRHFTPRNLI